jgi:cyanophycinase-like exopeptidase
MKNIILFSFIVAFLTNTEAYAQPYTSWKVGNPNDVVTAHQKGYVLAGGGGDNDEAMTWMLERAQGGDVVVLRASGSDGYNSYLYSSLGVTVNSVETLLIPSVAAANDPYVLTQVANAEVVFIAGGDQYQYYQNWRGTLLNDTLNYLINTKQITIGGTSAGMMVLGKTYYAPDDLGVLSSEALSDPYHQYMSVIGRDDFINISLFQDVIMDTHFDDRSRAGRLSAFMARMETDWGLNSFGIACNEYTAVCVDENNIARVFGESPTYPDYAYFVQSNCDQPFSMPENCTAGQPLNWVKGNEALKVYRIGGNLLGTNRFNLNNWQTAAGGIWQDWHITNGVITQTAAVNNFCITSSLSEHNMAQLSAFPNPTSNLIEITLTNGEPISADNIKLFNLLEQPVKVVSYTKPGSIELDLTQLPAGTYMVRYSVDQLSATLRVIKQ